MGISNYRSYYPLRTDGNDVTGNNNPTTSPSVSYKGDWVEYSGYTNYFTVADNMATSDFGVQEYTYIFAVYRTDIRTDEWHINGGTGDVLLDYDASGGVTFTVGAYSVTSTVAVPSNQWSVIAITRTPTLMKIVVDNVVTELVTPEYIHTYSTSPMLHGAYSMYCLERDFRFYQFALTDEEIYLVGFTSIPEIASLPEQGLDPYDLDPFGDASLTQSFLFNDTWSNAQGTNNFDGTSGHFETGGFLETYNSQYLANASTQHPTVNGHGIIGDVDCSFSIFREASPSPHFGMVAFGDVGQRYNVEIDHTATLSGLVYMHFRLHKSATDNYVSAPVPLGDLYSVIYTYEALTQTNRFYVNGILKATVAGFQMKFLDNPIVMTSNFQFGSTLYSRHDQICVWNKTLSPTEVLDVARTTVLPPIAPIITPSAIEMSLEMNEIHLPETITPTAVGITITANDIIEAGDPVLVIVDQSLPLTLSFFDPIVQEILIEVDEPLSLTVSVNEHSITGDAKVTPISFEITVEVLYTQDAVYGAVITPEEIQIHVEVNEPPVAGEQISSPISLSITPNEPTVVALINIGTLQRSLDIIQKIGDNITRQRFTVVQKNQIEDRVINIKRTLT